MKIFLVILCVVIGVPLVCIVGSFLLSCFVDKVLKNWPDEKRNWKD
jgi:H+/gluconate symporter-like permease